MSDEFMNMARLARELEDILDGLSPLEKALVIARAIREGGGEREIDADAVGGFGITWRKGAPR
jgi:hypothetical protein